METRHPVGGPFGSEFPEICNHCGVMTAWSRKKDLKILRAMFAFYEKTTPRGKIFKIGLCTKVYMATPIDVVFKCRKICSTGNWRNRALFTKQKTNKIWASSQTAATAQIALKICQGQPPTFGSHYFRFHPNRFTFGGVIGLAERAKAVLLPHRVFSW